MPQELALYSEFTLRETLNYFGHIFGMDSIKINERTEFLIEFLDLPKGKRLIRELSGGQQRRASLAAALLQVSLFCYYYKSNVNKQREVSLPEVSLLPGKM